MVNKCYDFLISNFGHVDIKGSLYIAELVNCNIESSQFKYGQAYDIIADKYDTNASAIERSIRHYITTVMDDLSLAKVCEVLDYPMNGDDKITLKITEFVPLLKRKLTVLPEE